MVFGFRSGKVREAGHVSSPEAGTQIHTGLQRGVGTTTSVVGRTALRVRDRPRIRPDWCGWMKPRWPLTTRPGSSTETASCCRCQDPLTRSTWQTVDRFADEDRASGRTPTRRGGTGPVAVTRRRLAGVGGSPVAGLSPQPNRFHRGRSSTAQVAQPSSPFRYWRTDPHPRRVAPRRRLRIGCARHGEAAPSRSCRQRSDRHRAPRDTTPSCVARPGSNARSRGCRRPRNEAAEPHGDSRPRHSHRR